MAEGRSIVTLTDRDFFGGLNVLVKRVTVMLVGSLEKSSEYVYIYIDWNHTQLYVCDPISGFKVSWGGLRLLKRMK